MNGNPLYSMAFPSLGELQRLDLEDVEYALEQLLRENESLKEETTVFGSYIKRVQPTSIASGFALFEDDAMSDSGASDSQAASRKGKKKNKDAASSSASSVQNGLGSVFGSQPTPMLSVEQKLEILSHEMDELKAEMDRENTTFERYQENVRAKMEAIDARIAEVKKDTYEFKRDIVQGEMTRTNRVMAEKVVRYFEEKLKSKEALVDKLRLKNTALKAQVQKFESQLRQREDMGDVLHAIDFDQLKIENQQFVEKIEERNNELLRLKVTTGNAVLVLNDLTEKLNKLTAESQWLRNEIKTRRDALNKIDDEIGKVMRTKEDALEANQTLRKQHEDVNVPEILDYVRQKQELYDLTKLMKNWERKVEIAESNIKLYKGKTIKDSMAASSSAASSAVAGKRPLYRH